MRMKFIGLLLSTVLLLTACGSDGYEPIRNPNWVPPEHKEENTVAEENTVSEEIPIESEEIIQQDLNYDVEVILKAYIFDNNGIDSYIEQLKTDNPEGKYAIYNDEYYISTITESERLEFINGLLENNMDEILNSLIQNEQYAGAFIKIEYDEELQNFKVYVDKDVYEQNAFVYLFGSSLTLKTISDTFQAYNFIAPEDRVINITYIDNETGNIIE